MAHEIEKHIYRIMWVDKHEEFISLCTGLSWS